MISIKSIKNNKIIFILCFLLNSTSALADYFAYIPDQANEENNKLLHVVNTKYNVLVDSIPIIGSPRDVVLSHRADFVFVSSVSIEGSLSDSKVSVIDTYTNQLMFWITINNTKKNVRGLTITKDDTTLFVTHTGGITRITQPTYSPVQTHLNLQYSGTSLVLSDDEQYLFVIGTDANNNDGISVVDISQETMTEIATANYSLGTGADVSSIVFDKLYKELYVINRSNKSLNEGGQLINFGILNYDTPDSLQLEVKKTKFFASDSYPLDVALNADSTELYVVLSHLPSDTDKDNNPDLAEGTGNGSIVVLNPSDITGELISNINDLSAEGGGNGYQSLGAIHPLSVAFDNSGKLHVVKQIWNEYPGTYVSSINDTSSVRTGVRNMSEGTSVHLGKISSSQLTGKFVGAECSFCPKGIDLDSQPVIHPSAINPFMLLFAFIFFIPYRLKRNENNHFR